LDILCWKISLIASYLVQLNQVVFENGLTAGWKESVFKIFQRVSVEVFWIVQTDEPIGIGPAEKEMGDTV